MNIELDKLPEDVHELHRIITSLVGKIEYLEELQRLYMLEKFGSKSEGRHIDSPPGNQIFIFPPAEAPEPPAEEELEEVKSHTRRKRGRRPLPEHLPRKEVVIDVPEEEKICACGEMMDRIGEDVSERLHYIPARIEVERTIRPKYACKHCEGVEDDGPTVRQSPAPPTLIPGGNATESLLAHIAVSKFADGLPLYRQCKIFSRLDVDIPSSTISSWMIQAANHCRLLVELMEEEIRGGPLIHIDESTMQVLKENGRKNTSVSYIWVFCGGMPDAPVRLFIYQPTRGADVAARILKGYAGYVMTDGYSGYSFLEGRDDIGHLKCMVHARRYFSQIVKANKKDRGKSTKKLLAEQAMDFFSALYRVEREASDANLGPEEILELRQKKSAPVMADFKQWLEARQTEVPPKSLIGKAIQYTLNHWDGLTLYLTDGSLPIDNNLAENVVRPFAVGRKNWLFAGSPKGAETSAIFFSLIETAKANGLDPHDYLCYLFKQLPFAESREDHAALLPNRLTMDDIHTATTND